MFSAFFSTPVFAADTSAQVQPVAKTSTELGFVDKYFPLGMDDYAPAVDDTSTKVGTWAGSILCFPLVGWGVGEFLMLGDKAPADSDAMMIGLIHTGFVALGVVLSMTGVGAIVGIPLILAVEFWFAPVAMLNAWNRGLRSGKKRAGLQRRKEEQNLAFADEAMAF